MSISHPTTHSTQIPNPNIYLNYLPSKTAKQFEIARDLYLATLGALIWDMLVTLPADLILLKSGCHPTFLAYFLSRLCALGYVALSVTVKIHPVSHCTAIEYATTICWVVASGSGSFLFFQRVKTVYSRIKIVYWTFFFLLLTNIGLTLLVPLGARLRTLPGTGYCINIGLKPYAAAAPIARLAYDSCVFLAISIRIATMQGVSGESLSWRTFTSRKALSRIIRAIFRGGQQYYLMSIFSNILVSVFVVIPSIGPIYQLMFTVPDVALSSSMACRVFRNLKITTDKIDNAMSEVLFNKPRSSLGFGTTTETSRASVSMRTRVNSNASSIYLPPPPPIPELEVRLRSMSMTSLRLREGDVERYSILKVKPMGNAGTTRMSTSWGPAGSIG